jgi:chemotaxis protein CheC
MELTPLQYDTIKEVINIGVGRAAGILNKMFTHRMNLEVPSVKILSSDDLIKELDDGLLESISSVNLSFKGKFSGLAKLIFPTESAAKLVTAFTEEDTDEEDLDEIRSATLAEIGNIVLNSLMGSIGNSLSLRINYSTPIYIEDRIEQLLNIKKAQIEPYSLLAKTRFHVEELNISGNFVLLFEIGSLENFIALIDSLIDSIEDDD